MAKKKKAKRRRRKVIQGRKPKPNIPLAMNIESFRELRGMSLAELADDSGVPYRSLQRLEEGVSVNPPVWDLHSIALSLGTSMEVLLGIKEPDELPEIKPAEAGGK